MANTLNVDGMLHAITPRQFVEWKAYVLEDPDPIERLAEIVKRGLTILLSTQEKPFNADLLDPLCDEQREQQAASISPDQGAALFGPAAQPTKGLT